MSQKQPAELDVPESVFAAETAVEVFRAWIADGALHVVFDPETFRHDVSEWGRLFADISHHIANAVAADGQMPANVALVSVREAYERGIGELLTAERSGAVKGRTKH